MKSMASAVSASASAHGFPASFVKRAENSCLRRRIIAAALKSTSARIAGSTFFQVLNVSSAACIAFSAKSLLAFDTRPITSVFFAGLYETILSSVVMRSPPIISG
ncbi:hypothetical protein D3C79_729660 [compost metagenome]